MSLMRMIRAQLGLMSGGNESQNHFFDGSVPNQLTLKRGVPDAPGATVMSVVDGVVSFPGTPGGSAFYASRLAAGAIPHLGGVFVFDNALFDTGAEYSTTNGRFTPKVPGYYQINGGVSAGASSTGYINGYVRKNGTIASYGSSTPLGLVVNAVHDSVLVYLNGTTDYVEFFVYQNTGANLTVNTGTFSGFLARKA